MSELDKESLSALLDDEADELSLPRLLKSYDRDPEISEKWRSTFVEILDCIRLYRETLQNPSNLDNFIRGKSMPSAVICGKYK